MRGAIAWEERGIDHGRIEEDSPREEDVSQEDDLY